MSEIGADEARRHLPKLLDRVLKGERFVITRRGQPVAELIPLSDRDTTGIRKAIVELRNLRMSLARRGVKLKNVLGPGESLRDLTHEGHRD